MADPGQFKNTRRGNKRGRDCLSALTRSVALASVLVAAVYGQEPPPQPAPVTLASGAVLGFETPTGWVVTGPAAGFTTSLSTNRTQGSAALALVNPPNSLQLFSIPVASSASALAGLGEQGSIFQLDLMVPMQDSEEVKSSIEGFVSSPSRHLKRIALAKLSLSACKPGAYTTLRFPISDAIRSALGGANYNDLAFEFDITSPDHVSGSYIFDNLRVHSVSAPSTTGTTPPGYGGSVEVDFHGNAPISQSFALGPVQIPEGFHLKSGAATGTRVDLELGLDGIASVKCEYGPDAADTSHASYIVDSCTNGFEPGDLVNANWTNMVIAGATTAMILQAQLAKAPVGDLLGRGVLPPMPTFWGNSDTCIPPPSTFPSGARGAAKPVNVSSSCSQQLAEANQIVSNYFKRVNSSDQTVTSPSWVVAPVPEFAKRHGDAKPKQNVAPRALDGANALPFDDSGDLNPGGTFDAYWRLNGNLTPTAYAGTDRDTTHFEANLTAHGVVFGDDVDVVDMRAVADTDSGETTPQYMATKSSGTLQVYVFGSEIYSDTVDPSTGFTYDKTWSQDFDLPPIDFWIFSLTAGASVNAELSAQASAALQGADLSVTPSASLSAHVKGGVNIVVASGDVDASVDLVKVSTPLRAQAKWAVNTTPNICALTLGGSLRGDLTVSSGGGNVKLNASFGPCPFCYTDSETLVSWGALASTTVNLFNASPETPFFGLPASMCGFPVNVSIGAPIQGATLSAGLPVTMQGIAAPTDPNTRSTSTYTWTFTPANPTDTVTVNSGANTANPVVTFGPPHSGSKASWIIKMTAKVTSDGFTRVTETGSATPVAITVQQLPRSASVTELVGASDGTIVTPDATGLVTIPVPQYYTAQGLVSGASGKLNTTFTLATCADGTATCTNPVTPTALTTTSPASTTPSVALPALTTYTYYKLTIATTANGNPFASSSVIVYAPILF
ncbi:MAG TPA: hypothetical protein VH351_07450 [Bryobacteraceae bacterium]|jgi:hypothetical protein|nr:hypothetical protein [Bryobacteraceae bacterium]